MDSPKTKSPPSVGADEGPESSTLRKRLNEKNNTKTADDYTRERYWLDGQIKRLLRGDAARTDPKKHPANVHRTIGCTWIRVDDLSVVKPRGRSSYHYKGLMTCGSVHTCTLCSSKIQERRRQEVAEAIAYASTIDRGVVMVSYTFPHRVDQPLALLLKLQSEAIKHLRGSRAYMALMLRCKNAGRIRALEVTHGLNGWHPHTHELLILDPQTPASWLRFELAQLWFKACRKVGLYDPNQTQEADFLRYSVDVAAGNEGAAGYLAKLDDQTKWGISHELTKSSSKQGRMAGVHPFKLAAQAHTSALFLEYVHAMKGQRQLVWSRGLKSAVGVSEKSDEEIAQEETSKVDDRIPITPNAWRYVIGNDARCEVLQAAKDSGSSGVGALIRLLGYVDEDDG